MTRFEEIQAQVALRMRLDATREWLLVTLANLLLWVFFRLCGQSGACANRRWARLRRGQVEVAVTVRDLREPDGYSREELLLMLREVRRHEKTQGWSVPEPSPETL